MDIKNRSDDIHKVRIIRKLTNWVSIFTGMVLYGLEKDEKQEWLVFLKTIHKLTKDIFSRKLMYKICQNELQIAEKANLKHM